MVTIMPAAPLDGPALLPDALVEQYVKPSGDEQAALIVAMRLTALGWVERHTAKSLKRRRWIAMFDGFADVMRAGRIDDGMSEVDGPHVEIGKRWAKKTDVSDGERIRAAAQDQTLTTRFLVRHDSLTATITGKDRLVCEGRTYAVTGAKEWGGRGVGIEITAASSPDAAS